MANEPKKLGGNKLTYARAKFLIAVLFAVDETIHNTHVFADKPSGVLRCGARKRPMFTPLQQAGLIEWDYTKAYIKRDLYDVWLTEKGYHIAARCLFWSVRQELTAPPQWTKLAHQLKNPIAKR